MKKDDMLWAFIGTLPIIGFILVMLTHKEDKYAIYYGKQGLVLGIAWIVVELVLWLLVFTIPLALIWNLVVLIFWILSVINAFSGKEKPTPIIGKFAEKFKF